MCLEEIKVWYRARDLLSTTSRFEVGKCSYQSCIRSLSLLTSPSFSAHTFCISPQGLKTKLEESAERESERGQKQSRHFSFQEKVERSFDRIIHYFPMSESQSEKESANDAVTAMFGIHKDSKSLLVLELSAIFLARSPEVDNTQRSNGGPRKKIGECSCSFFVVSGRGNYIFEKNGIRSCNEVRNYFILVLQASFSSLSKERQKIFAVSEPYAAIRISVLLVFA